MAGEAQLNTVPEASGFTWELSPAHFFEGPASGTGNKTAIRPTGLPGGTGKITFRFSMPGGEIFPAQKTFAVGGLRDEDVTLHVINQNGTPADQMDGTWLMSPNTIYHLLVRNGNSSCPTSGYTWDLPNGYILLDKRDDSISVNTNSSPGGLLTVYAHTCCGNQTAIVTARPGIQYQCGDFTLSLITDHAKGETTMTLENQRTENTFRQRPPWEIDIFGPSDVLMFKKEDLHGKSTVVSTGGWDRGIYFVRVMTGNNMLLGRLPLD